MKHFLALAFTLLSLVGSSQTVFVVDQSYKANMIAYIADTKQQANMVIERVTYQYQAKATPTISYWYYVDYSYQADIRVFFTKDKNKATHIIYFQKW